MADFSIIELVKAVAPSTLGAAGGWLLGWKQRKAADVKTSADQTDAITRRIQTIFDGYERRIEDLQDEVAELRDEITELRKNPPLFGQ